MDFQSLQKLSKAGVCMGYGNFQSLALHPADLLDQVPPPKYAGWLDSQRALEHGGQGNS